jgi:hypothetical protein
MLKLLFALLISLVAAVPATAIYVGILNALKPLLDRLRQTKHTEFSVKTQGI